MRGWWWKRVGRLVGGLGGNRVMVGGRGILLNPVRSTQVRRRVAF